MLALVLAEAQSPYRPRLIPKLVGPAEEFEQDGEDGFANHNSGDMEDKEVQAAHCGIVFVDGRFLYQ